MFLWIANVYWLAVIGVHQGNQAIHKIRYILEGASLVPRTVYSEWLFLKCLYDKIGNNPSIIGMHPRTICVENSRNSHLTSGIIIFDVYI